MSNFLSKFCRLGLLALLFTASLAHANTAPNTKIIDKLASKGVPKRALKRALTAYDDAEDQHLIKNHLLTLVDFELSSDKIRLWVINPETGTILYQGHVAHGSGSGVKMATVFGNNNQSHTSSLGAYITEGIYVGKHGQSLRLDGLEPGVNDKAESRAIVMHGASYMTDGFIKSMGRAGRSWGCFALNPADVQQVIKTIKNGSMIYAYAPQQEHDKQFS